MMQKLRFIIVELGILDFHRQHEPDGPKIRHEIRPSGFELQRSLHCPDLNICSLGDDISSTSVWVAVEPLFTLAETWLDKGYSWKCPFSSPQTQNPRGLVHSATGISLV